MVHTVLSYISDDFSTLSFVPKGKCADVPMKEKAAMIINYNHTNELEKQIEFHFAANQLLRNIIPKIM